VPELPVDVPHSCKGGGGVAGVVHLPGFVGHAPGGGQGFGVARLVAVSQGEGVQGVEELGVLLVAAGIVLGQGGVVVYAVGVEVGEVQRRVPVEGVGHVLVVAGGTRLSLELSQEGGGGVGVGVEGTVDGGSEGGNMPLRGFDAACWIASFLAMTGTAAGKGGEEGEEEENENGYVFLHVGLVLWCKLREKC